MISLIGSVRWVQADPHWSKVNRTQEKSLRSPVKSLLQPPEGLVGHLLRSGHVLVDDGRVAVGNLGRVADEDDARLLGLVDRRLERLDAAQRQGHDGVHLLDDEVLYVLDLLLAVAVGCALDEVVAPGLGLDPGRAGHDGIDAGRLVAVAEGDRPRGRVGAVTAVAAARGRNQNQRQQRREETNSALEHGIPPVLCWSPDGDDVSIRPVRGRASTGSSRCTRRFPRRWLARGRGESGPTGCLPRRNGAWPSRGSRRRRRGRRR